MESAQEKDNQLPEPDPLSQEDTPTLVLEKRSTIGEIWDFLRVRKRFWLAPIIVALMLLGGLIFLAGSAGVVSPFVYMM
jgi:hypothetical protein